jgi:3-dehydroquinate dehydratase/shikimate dehydrogenase
VAGSKNKGICLTLTGETLQENLDALAAQRRYIDLVELRADFLLPGEWTHINRFPKRAAIPTILTLRLPRDGGRFRGEESKRRQIFRKALKAEFGYFDLEEQLNDSSLEKSFRAGGGRVIRSFHELGGLPEGLTDRIRRLRRHPSDLPKAACLLQNAGELVRMLGIFKELLDTEKILVGMGNYGIVTRILAPRLGSFLTYCSDTADPAAPGHMSPAMLQEVYRYRDLRAGTSVFAIVGDPIAHSLSPVIHNRGFATLGLDAVYVPFRAKRIEAFFSAAEALDIRGASVTMPHKEEVLRYLENRDPAVQAIGACNTLVKASSGWRGFNTDYSGFLAPIREDIDKLAKEKRCATVIGAGGAARSALWALVQEGFRVLVLNRTVEKAQKLARDFGVQWAGLNKTGVEEARAYSALIVQSTRVGMEPLVGSNPLRGFSFKGHEIVYELIYSPPRTALMEEALEAGCRVIEGGRMLIAQALEQFKYFTGREYPESEETLHDRTFGRGREGT